MTYKVNDYLDILHRFDRIGMLEYANANERRPECPIEQLRQYKHMPPEKWRKLTRQEQRGRMDFLKRIWGFERANGLDL